MNTIDVPLEIHIGKLAASIDCEVRYLGGLRTGPYGIKVTCAGINITDLVMKNTLLCIAVMEAIEDNESSAQERMQDAARLACCGDL